MLQRQVLLRQCKVAGVGEGDRDHHERRQHQQAQYQPGERGHDARGLKPVHAPNSLFTSTNRDSAHSAPSTATIRVAASMVPSPQRSVSLIWTATYSAIISTLPPPRLAGGASKPSEKAETRGPGATSAGTASRRDPTRNAAD